MVLSVLAVPAAGSGAAVEAFGPVADQPTAETGNPGSGNGAGGGGSGGPPSEAGGNSGDQAQGSDGNQGQGSAGNQAPGNDGDQAQGSDGNQGQGNDGAQARGSDGNQGQGNDGNQAQGSDGTRGQGNDGNGPPDHANGVNSGVGAERGPPAEGDGPSPDGGPTVRVSRGPPDDPGRGDQFDGPEGRPGDPPRTSVVDVSVSGARAGDDVSIDVSPGPATAGPVGFDEVSLTVRRGGDFTMQVTSSPGPLAGSPAFEPVDAAESLGRIRLGHSITNEEVEGVSFVVRVSKARLLETGTNPEDVVLYRFADREWTPLPTEVVGETGTDYLMEVDSPGLSEFAVGASRPSFEAFRAEASARTVEPGERVRFSGRVANVGSADGVYQASLVVDDEVVETRRVTVAAGGTRQVNFHWTFDRPGSHSVRLGTAAVGEVVVEAPDERSRRPAVGRALSFTIDRVLDVGRALWTPWDVPAVGG